MVITNNKTKKSNVLLIVICLILITIAGFRPIVIDNDSLNYVSVLHVNLSEANFIDKEPTFWIINEINKILCGGNEYTATNNLDNKFERLYS